MVISIGELQKNISLLKNLKEPLIVIDKRTNKEVAIIQPFTQNDQKILQELLEKRFESSLQIEDLDEAFESAYIDELKRKYGAY